MLPTCFAATWSTDTPTWMSLPSVLRARVPVRKEAFAHLHGRRRRSSPGSALMQVQAANHLELVPERGQGLHRLAERVVGADAVGHQFPWFAPFGK